MTAQLNVFAFENRIDELFEAVFPEVASGPALHPSGRAFKPVLTSVLGALVPDGGVSRRLQNHREYFKIDFQDFLDFATSELPQPGRLADFADRTAIFYESFSDKGVTSHANWEGSSISITDAVVARDKMFITVLMRFLVYLDSESKLRPPEECGASITFAPESYSGNDQLAGSFGEWERAMWHPPVPEDLDWRISNSGEYTSYLLDETKTGVSPVSPTLSQEFRDKVREGADQNHGKFGAFFEIARLGLLLPSYVNFMYDLIVDERRCLGNKPDRARHPRRGKPVSFDTPIYKIVRSIRIIRPDASLPQEVREWTPPSYSYLVKGHWRNFEDQSRKGRDADGNEVSGRTWVREYKKYEDQEGNQFNAESRTRNPRIVIGVKQTLNSARDLIESFGKSTEPLQTDRPSPEWMANERAKLTAALRYLILKGDGFRCRKCGRDAATANYVRLEVDHIIPVSKWGRTVEENLQTVCRDCNKGKSDNL
jgi:hypothetical protein